MYPTIMPLKMLQQDCALVTKYPAEPLMVLRSASTSLQQIAQSLRVVLLIYNLITRRALKLPMQLASITVVSLVLVLLRRCLTALGMYQSATETGRRISIFPVALELITQQRKMAHLKLDLRFMCPQAATWCYGH